MSGPCDRRFGPDPARDDGWRRLWPWALIHCARVEEAQAPFDWLTVDDARGFPATHLPVTLSGLGRACLLLEADSATAASIYHQLLPHAGTFNWSSIVSQPNDLGLACA